MPVGRALPRVAIITVGQSPRPDLLPELQSITGDARYDEFGALDGVPRETIAASMPNAEAFGLFTRLGDGSHAIVDRAFVARRLDRLIASVDGLGYDLLILMTTGLFGPLATRTPMVHGQRAVDAWVTALVAGYSRIGLIYPLPRQDAILAEFGYGTLLQTAHATIKGGHSARLADAADRISGTDLIVMASVGYSEAMAQQVALKSGKPVVTARRIIAGAARIRLSEITGRSVGVPADDYTGAELLKHLPEAAGLLTPREREVLVHVLEGAANKLIARTLGISYRTVEIHRARAMGKLGAASVAELIRRALTASSR